MATPICEVCGSPEGNPHREKCPRAPDAATQTPLRGPLQRLTFDELRHAMEWSDGDNVSVAAQVIEVLDALKYAHEQREDDRCWMDITKVYAAAGLPPPDTSVGDKTKMLANCARFVDRCCTEGDGTWRSYVELEQENERLRAETAMTLTTLRGVRAIVTSLAERVAAQSELLSKRAEKKAYFGSFEEDKR